MTRLEACSAAASALLPTGLTAPPRPPAADDDRYHRLRAAIEAGGAAGAPPLEWAIVEADATALLRDRAPDLLVLAYLAAALHRRRALDGLLTGVLLVRRALADAPALTPPPSRARARGLAITWLIDQVIVALRPAAPPRNPDDQAILAALQGELRLLRDHMTATLDRHAPSFGNLLRLVDALVLPPAVDSPSRARATREEATPAPAPPPHAVPTTHPSAGSSPDHPLPPSRQPAPPTDPTDASSSTPDLGASAPPPPPTLPPPGAVAARDRHLRAHGDALAALAHHLRALDPQDPAAYRLHRVGLFLHLDHSPPVRDGRTAIGRLSHRDRQRLDDHERHGRQADLVDTGERLLAAARLDLDLHHRIARALTELGAPAAAAAIRDELRALLARLPDLPHLLDRDGAPLASADTRAWLGPAPCAQPPTAPGSTATLLPAIDAPSAAPPTQHEHIITPGAEADLRRRLALAEARLHAGATDHALLLLRGLLPALDHHDLDRWSPTLAARVLTPLAAALPAGDERQRLLVRLGAIAPEALAQLLESSP